MGTPFYKDHVLYQVIDAVGTPSVRAWQFSGWKAESMSWKTGCYIHAGLSSTGPLSFKGPDAGQFLESVCINSFAKFPVGSMKSGSCAFATAASTARRSRSRASA